jgi:bla regulator protein blaR1
VETIFQICLSNSLVALVLAVVATAVAAIGRRPALVHALWVLVLIKLVTPPLVPVPLSSPTPRMRLSSRTAHSTEPRVYYTWRYWDGIGARADLISARVKVPVDPAAAQARAKVAAEQAARKARLAAKAAETVTIPPPRASTIPQRTTTATFLARPGDLLKRVLTTTPLSSQAWALASWLGIALLWWSLTALRLRKFLRLLRSASRASAELQDQTSSLAARLGLRRVPEVWLVPSAIRLLMPNPSKR